MLPLKSRAAGRHLQYISDIDRIEAWHEARSFQSRTLSVVSCKVVKHRMASVSVGLRRLKTKEAEVSMQTADITLILIDLIPKLVPRGSWLCSRIAWLTRLFKPTFSRIMNLIQRNFT